VGEGGGVPGQGEQGEQMTLADRIDLLFRTVYPKGGKPYSLEEVAAGIERLTGEKISANAIWKLRKGKHSNPTKKTIEGLASFFGVPPSYFFGESTEQVAEEMELLAAMRDSRGAQLRSFLDLSPAGQAMVADLIAHAARMEQQQHRREDPTAEQQD
jgi:transcriptional regulator with XRE-family HTH domain